MNKRRRMEAQVLEAWNLFEDDEISTERLMAMVSDYTGFEVDKISEVLIRKGIFEQWDKHGRVGEVVAWMRDSGDPSDENFVISNKVKELWLAANPQRVERYTIPLTRKLS